MDYEHPAVSYLGGSQEETLSDSDMDSDMDWDWTRTRTGARTELGLNSGWQGDPRRSKPSA
jgi:hypothetical protein